MIKSSQIDIARITEGRKDRRTPSSKMEAKLVDMARLPISLMVFVSLLLITPGHHAFVPNTDRRPKRALGEEVGELYLANKWVIIGGNLPGLDPDQEEDTYSMSKKERRRREREKASADFKSGKHKLKKTKAVDYDKLEAKVSRENSDIGRIQTNTRKKTRVEKKLSVKAARIKKQRTVGGTIDSVTERAVSQYEQIVEIRTAKRANKTVTMIQGMTLPMKERKILLKEMKAKLGGGGTLVEGVLELQGSHADRILDILKSKGYNSARVVGGGKGKRK